MKRGRTKTDQQYLADILKLMSSQYDKKVKALKAASLKQTVLFHPETCNTFKIILTGRPSEFDFNFSSI